MSVWAQWLLVFAGLSVLLWAVGRPDGSTREPSRAMRDRWSAPQGLSVKEFLGRDAWTKEVVTGWLVCALLAAATLLAAYVVSTPRQP